MIDKEQWNEFFSSPLGIEFIKILRAEERSALEALSGCHDIETYKLRDGYLQGIRNVLDEINRLGGKIE